MTNTTGIANLLTAVFLLAAGGMSPAAALESPPQVEFLDPGTANAADAPSVKKYLLSDSLQEKLGPGDMDLWDSLPAPPESSGTWLRRGWWSAEIDAVVMIRKWDSQNAVLAFDASSSPAKLLQLGRTSPSAGSARLNLGRFLFRDIENRDHTMEFTVFGGNEFLDTCHLDSNSPNALLVNQFIDSSAPISFNGASSMDVTYASRLNYFELNYKVTSRMDHDRMELQPDGRWIRRATPGFTYHGIAGMRYTEVAESVIWTAEDIVDNTGTVVFNGEDGLYRVGAENDMFGFQAGGGMTYEADRWSLTFFTKGGIMMNDAKADGLLRYTDPATGAEVADAGFINSDRSGTLPLLLQGGIIGRYHLRPNVSIRAGWEFMYLTAMAVAPHNVNFTADDGKLKPTASPFYQGLTLGGEVYW